MSVCPQFVPRREQNGRVRAAEVARAARNAALSPILTFQPDFPYVLHHVEDPPQEENRFFRRSSPECAYIASKTISYQPLIMQNLRVASFGIRGFVGQSLTPKIVMDFASAFAAFNQGGCILLGRDTRYSSDMIHSAVMASLLSAGCEVMDFGVCPTPILQFSVTPFDAAGAISISGGHNATGWNAVTLIGPDGSFLEPMSGETVLEHYHAGQFINQGWQQMGSVKTTQNFSEPYFDALEKHVNMPAIRDAGLTAVIDPVGGAGCPYLESFAERLGFNLVPVNGEPTGYLAREPEPRPRSALPMASIIRRLGGDVGFVLSSDMGRLSLVTKEGEPASEEYTFSVIAEHVLSKHSGCLVTNCCTTRTIDDIGRKHGVPIVKTPVGQAFIMAALADEKGVIGGEGNGSVALPGFSMAFDGFLMMALILEAMAESGRSIQDRIDSLPRYHIVKKMIACESRQGYRALAGLKEEILAQGDGQIDLTDGLRVDWDDGWVHIRASRTQQIVRVISEATTRERAEARADEMTRRMETGS